MAVFALVITEFTLSVLTTISMFFVGYVGETPERCTAMDETNESAKIVPLRVIISCRFSGKTKLSTP
jgi:hypothetical protein